MANVFTYDALSLRAASSKVKWWQQDWKLTKDQTENCVKLFKVQICAKCKIISYTGCQTFMKVLQMVYFRKALGPSTAKMMILGVKYKNVQNPICFKFKLLFSFFYLRHCVGHTVWASEDRKGRSQASAKGPKPVWRTANQKWILVFNIAQLCCWLVRSVGQLGQYNIFPSNYYKSTRQLGGERTVKHEIWLISSFDEWVSQLGLAIVTMISGRDGSTSENEFNDKFNE